MLTDWRPAPTHWPRIATDVQVWRIPLDPPEERLAACRALLADDERARSDRYHFPADGRRFAVARGALRCILSAITFVAPAALTFDYDAHGKPSLAAGQTTSAVEFNVSHAGDLALVAVSVGRAIGVDVERLRPIEQMDDLVRQTFTARERAAFALIPLDRRRRAFFEVWTRKEAMLKALGVGLSREPSTIDVWGDPDIQLGDPAESALWTVLELDPGMDYVGALAVRARNVTVQTWEWRAEAFETDRYAAMERGEA